MYSTQSPTNRPAATRARLKAPGAHLLALEWRAPFEARLHPEYAAHLHDYDHLSRLAEWQGLR